MARGKIIDGEGKVRDYPHRVPSAVPLVEAEWEMGTMEPKSGRYPGRKGPIQQSPSVRYRAMRR